MRSKLVGRGTIAVVELAFVVTVNDVLLVEEPPAFETVIGPLTAPAGTFTWTLVSESTVTGVACLLLEKNTFVPVPKFVPVITTFEPTLPARPR